MSERHERLSHSRVLTTNEEKTFRESSVGKIRSVFFFKVRNAGGMHFAQKGGGGGEGWWKRERGKKKKQSYS